MGNPNGLPACQDPSQFGSFGRHRQAFVNESLPAGKGQCIQPETLEFRFIDESAISSC